MAYKHQYQAREKNAHKKRKKNMSNTQWTADLKAWREVGFTMASGRWQKMGGGVNSTGIKVTQTRSEMMFRKGLEKSTSHGRFLISDKEWQHHDA